MNVVNPITCETIAQIGISTREEIEDPIQAANNTICTFRMSILTYAKTFRRFMIANFNHCRTDCRDGDDGIVNVTQVFYQRNDPSQSVYAKTLTPPASSP
jgi:hypothetical protein